MRHCGKVLTSGDGQGRAPSGLMAGAFQPQWYQPIGAAVKGFRGWVFVGCSWNFVADLGPHEAADCDSFLCVLHFFITGNGLRQIGCEHMVILAFLNERNFLRRRALSAQNKSAAPVIRRKRFTDIVLASIMGSKPPKCRTEMTGIWSHSHGKLAGFGLGRGRMA